MKAVLTTQSAAAPAGNRRLLLGLAGIALLLAATLLAYRPVTPVGANGELRKFSAYRTQAILKDLLGGGLPHPLGSADAARVRGLIVQRLSALGYGVELQTGFTCNDQGVCANLINVVAMGEPIPAGSDAVLLAAHYDSVAAGPGAADDCAGVATVLEVARIVAAMPAPKHPIVLLLDDGEEAGLLGALLFVRQHPLAKTIRAVVNLDARGTSGASVMFETGSANSWAIDRYRSAVSRPASNSLYYFGYKFLPSDTDFSVFRQAGYQGLNFAFVGDVGHYHTPLDTWENTSASSIQHQGDNALAALLAVANAETLRHGAGESVFFDVFGRALVSWPVALALPASIAALILLLAAIWILLRARALSGGDLRWGLAASLGMLILGVAATAGLLALLIATRKVPPLGGLSWIAHPLPMTIAAWALALLASGLAGTLLARRSNFWGAWAAAASLMAACSVASALFAPATSFVFLPAALAFPIAAGPCLWAIAHARAPSAAAIGAAALVPLLAIFLTVLPLVNFAYGALGSVAWPLTTLFLGVGALTLLPLLVGATRRNRQRLVALCATIAACAAALTFLMPTYSPGWPQRLNFEYWLDVDSGKAFWHARPDSLHLPASIERAANFDRLLRPRYDGSGSLWFHAPAPRLDLAAPRLEVVSRPPAKSSAPPVNASRALSTAGGSVRYDLHIVSARGAPEILVVFPASARIKEILAPTAAGMVHATLQRVSGGATRLDLIGLSAAGLDFSIEAAGAPPLMVQVFDQSYDFEAGEFLRRARPGEATSSQDGDLTVVHRTVSLEPAADR